MFKFITGDCPTQLQLIINDTAQYVYQFPEAMEPPHKQKELAKVLCQSWLDGKQVIIVSYSKVILEGIIEFFDFHPDRDTFVEDFEILLHHRNPEIGKVHKLVAEPDDGLYLKLGWPMGYFEGY